MPDGKKDEKDNEGEEIEKLHDEKDTIQGRKSEAENKKEKESKVGQEELFAAPTLL